MIRNIGKLFNNAVSYADSAGNTKKIQDTVAQSPNIKAVEEIKRENTVNYKIPIKDGDKFSEEQLKISYDSSKSAKTFITLGIYTPGRDPYYGYELEQEGNSIKLKYFENTSSCAVYDDIVVNISKSISKKLSEVESDEINKVLDLMIEQTPHYKTILNYIKQKTKPGEIVLDK